MSWDEDNEVITVRPLVFVGVGFFKSVTDMRGRLQWPFEAPSNENRYGMRG